MPLPVGHRLKLICGAVAHESDASLIHFAADNLGELVFFNAYRWHSGHVPREGSMPLADNPLRKRGEAVGFAAELKDGRWVLFRMCKGKHGQAPSLCFLRSLESLSFRFRMGSGSTDDNLSEKLLATDANAAGLRSGQAKAKYDLSEDEVRLRAEHSRHRGEL